MYNKWSFAFVMINIHKNCNYTQYNTYKDYIRRTNVITDLHSNHQVFHRQLKGEEQDVVLV